MPEPLTHLGDIPVRDFLRDYWAAEASADPAMAFPDFVSPISGEELAGMALEEAVESRLVLEHGDEGPWQLRTGPFTEKDFLSLPPSHWTLLVQAVDHWLSSVAELKDYFRFLPDWRLDDVMISYAADKGSVGPHFDYYDVFLLQAEGRRLWHQGPKADDSSPRLEGTPLKILKNFEPENSWLLEPGDLLYLPPQFSHWGIAQGPCVTISIGFRAPSAATILEDLAAELAQELPQHQRYSDPRIAAAVHPAEIDPASVARLQAQLAGWLQQPQKIARWLGAVMTEAKYPETVALDAGGAEDWREQLAAGGRLVLNPGSRCAFCREPQILFVDGETFAAPLAFAEHFCKHHSVVQKDIDNFPEVAREGGLIEQLIAQGSLIYPPEDF